MTWLRIPESPTILGNGPVDQFLREQRNQLIRVLRSAEGSDEKAPIVLAAGLYVPVFTETVAGAVPPPTTATGAYLKDDGTWDTPAGGGDSFIDAVLFG